MDSPAAPAPPRLPPLNDIIGVTEFGLSTRFNNLRGRVVFFRPTILRRSGDGRYHNRVIFVGFDGVLYLCHPDGTAKRSLELATVTSIVEDKGCDVALLSDFPLVLRFHKPEVKRADQASELPLPGLRQFVALVRNFAPNVSVTKGLQAGIGSLQLHLEKPPEFKPPGRLPILAARTSDPDAEALAMGLSAAQYARLMSKRHPAAIHQGEAAKTSPVADDGADSKSTKKGLRFAEAPVEEELPVERPRALRVDPAAVLQTGGATFHQMVDGASGNAPSTDDHDRNDRATVDAAAVDEPWNVDPAGESLRQKNFDVPTIESGSGSSSPSCATPASTPSHQSSHESVDALPAALPLQPRTNLQDAINSATARLLGVEAADGVEIEIIKASQKYAELVEDMDDKLWAADHPEEVELENRRHAEAVAMHDRIRRMYRRFLPGKLDIAEKVIEHCVEKARDDPSAPREEIVVLEALIDRFGPEPAPTPPTPAAEELAPPPLERAVMLRLRRRIFRLYVAYLPHKLPLLPTMLRTYTGSEVDWIDALLEKCGQPEPRTDDELLRARRETIHRLATSGIDNLPPNAELAHAADAVSQLFLDTVESPSAMRFRIERMYQLYHPEKVATVDSLLAKNRIKFESVDGPPRLLVEPPRLAPCNVSVAVQWEEQPSPSPTEAAPASEPDALVMASDSSTTRQAANDVCQEVLKRLVDTYGPEDLPEEIEMALQDIQDFRSLHCQQQVHAIYAAKCPENIERLPKLFEKYYDRPHQLLAAVREKYTSDEAPLDSAELRPYDDDLDALLPTHSARYKARNAPSVQEPEPRPKKKRPKPPRRNAVANCFLRQIANEAEAVADRVLDDVVQARSRMQQLEREVETRKRLNQERTAASSRLQLRHHHNVQGSPSDDSFSRECNLALLIAEACNRPCCRDGLLPTALDSKALRALAAAFAEHAAVAHGAAAVTARGPASALRSVAAL